MVRVDKPEILDRDGLPEEPVRRAYEQLARIHAFLGDTGEIIRAIRRDPLPVRRILDVGCATGAVLDRIRRKLGVEAVGVDLQPRREMPEAVEIVQADAICDLLPEADVAYSMHVGHHLPEGALVEMIRNVGRSCRRFILLDLVRHPVPLALFRTFVAPFVDYIVAEDGRRSVRRAYTPHELNGIARTALDGTGAAFRHTVTPFYTRQVIDISYNRPAAVRPVVSEPRRGERDTPCLAPGLPERSTGGSFGGADTHVCTTKPVKDYGDGRFG